MDKLIKLIEILGADVKEKIEIENKNLFYKLLLAISVNNLLVGSMLYYLR